MGKEFKIQIGQIFSDEKRNFVVTDREYINYERKPDKKGRVYIENQKWYKYTCNKCGWTEGWGLEGRLLKGGGCSCCSGRTVVYGINSIHDIAPWMIDLGVDREEAKKFTCQANKKIKCVCPNCKTTMYKVLNHIYKSKSIGCTCGDGFSYPEKFVCSILKQLNIEFEYQLTKNLYKWCDRYKYDFYVPSLNMIIETHGEQHYINSFIKRTLEEEQENDRIKKKLALKNGIKHYIELDCRESNLEWIKNGITNSKLNDSFNLRVVDWVKCEEYALGNLVKEVCDYWNNKEEWETTSDLGKIFNMHGVTISKYLKQGVRLGWCKYDAKEELMKSGISSSKKISKKVAIYINNKKIGIFNSCHELDGRSEELFGVKLDFRGISDVARGRRKTYKGFTFQYI